MITCRKNKRTIGRKNKRTIGVKSRISHSCPRLGKKELINLYALERICRVLSTDDDDFPLCLFLLQEICEKLVNIATFACQKELRHAVHGTHSTYCTTWKKYNELPQG